MILILIFFIAFNFNFLQEEYSNISLERLESLKKDTTYYPFEENGKWGYENALCKEIIKPQYQNAGIFNEGLAPVRIGDKYIYINKLNEIAFKRSFDFAEIFVNNKARVFDNDEIYFIDKKGNLIENFTFKSYSDLYSKYIDNYIEPIFNIYSIFRDSLSFKFSDSVFKNNTELLHFKNHKKNRSGRIDLDKRFEIDFLVRPASKPFESDSISKYYGKSYFINELNENIKKQLSSNTITLFVDNSKEYSHIDFPNTYNLYIFNNKKSDFYFKTFPSAFKQDEIRIIMGIQAKNLKGEWINLTSGVSFNYYICGLAYDYMEKPLYLLGNKYMKFNLPVFTGSFKTKLRVYVNSSNQKSREYPKYENFEDVYYYSNEYDGYVNPSQLIYLQKMDHPFQN